MGKWLRRVALGLGAVGAREVELELVATGRSRLTGSLVYDGQLCAPCDLGFAWRRIPSRGFRAIARLLWSVKP